MKSNLPDGPGPQSIPAPVSPGPSPLSDHEVYRIARTVTDLIKKEVFHLGERCEDVESIRVGAVLSVERFLKKQEEKKRKSRGAV